MRKTRLINHKNNTLALNMDWIPLLGDINPVKNLAKRMKASHQVVSGRPAAAIGLAYGIKQKSCWSLAELFANSKPKGTYACLLTIDQDNWYVIASHEGVVLAHGDRSYLNYDLAIDAINKLSLSYPNLELLEINNADEFIDGLLIATNKVNPLQKINYTNKKYFILLGLFILGLLWQLWPQSSNSASQLDHVQSQESWDQAIQKVLEENRIHGLVGTKKLLDIIQQQPLLINGWQMSNMVCAASAVVQTWLCKSEYKRDDLSADNKSFIKSVPSSWQLDFPSLDLIRSKWSIKVPSESLVPSSLPKSKMIERDWASELQYILPAFTSLHLGQPTAISISIPLADDGTEISPPSDLPNMASRKLTVSGPLRSAVLIKKISDAIAWQKVSIKYSPGVRSSTKTSSLTIQLEGTVYESRS